MERLLATHEEKVVERALNRFHLSDPEMRRLTRKVIRAQRELRRMVSKKTWRIYLALEEVVNARDLRLIEVAIKLGIDHGCRRKRQNRI
jgi:hypothetical protein